MNPVLRVTFLLPGDNLSGGVRVTVRMANLLRERGHVVRIALATHVSALWANRSLRPLWSRRFAGWLREFTGPVVRFRDVRRVAFVSGEIVVGVGTYMIPDLLRIRTPGIVKVRQHHGFPAHLSAVQRAAWAEPLTTITVSPTLVAELEQISGRPVSAVVPNGIDLTEYFPEPGVPREAIGTIYGMHPNKAPADILELMRRLAEHHPERQQIVFSTEPRPAGLPPGDYLRRPSLAEMRRAYSRARVWLLASHTEGLPAPVLEAMACGAVVVSTDNAGSASLIRDGVNGFLVGRGDFPAFLERVDRLWADPELRARMAAAGHATAASYGWPTAADRMERFLTSLVCPSLAA